MSESEVVATPEVAQETEQTPEVAQDGKGKKKEKVELPAFIKNRIDLWDTLFAQQQEELKTRPQNPIEVTLPDGRKVEATSNVTTPFDVAKKLSNSLANRIVVAKVNGQLWDLVRPIEDSCNLELLDFDTKEGKHTFWHSSAHILGQALEKHYKDARLCIGPPVDDGGFYYDVYLKDQVVHPTDYKNIEKIVDYIQKQKQPFQRLVLKKEDALKMFEENHFKAEIIRSKVPDGETCTAYRCGDLVDLCRGPHLPHTAAAKAMAVTKHGSSYWLGKADRESLQRIYGISFPDKDQLKEYKELLKKAEERDHRKVGLKQELIMFHEFSPGSCFFLPHGTRIYNRLIEFIRKQYWKRGYKEVITPNVYNIELWKCSGHYDNYKENMFLFDVEGIEFGVKPMNCPGHCLIFRNCMRSYRELPLRVADFGVLHRNEISGALTGLTRVRRFQQDDAHIFCTISQIEQEVTGVLDMLQECYNIFGFEFALQLSTRPEKALGDIETWNAAEKQLASCLDKFGKPWTVNPGDGAFYGPKIDIKLFDALKRQHQCATIQLDFQLPRRFELLYKNNEDKMEHPVMIHRAILGSVERMMAVLIEHTGGKWPFWLSPRQAIVVPVSDKYDEYGQKVYQQLHDAGYYVDIDLSNRQLPKKVREAQIEGHNFILVVGDKEMNEGTVNVRKRDSQGHDDKTVTMDELLATFAELTATHQ